MAEDIKTTHPCLTKKKLMCVIFIEKNKTTQRDDLLSAETEATALVEVPRRRLATHPKGVFGSNFLWWGLHWVFDRPTLVHQS